MATSLNTLIYNPDVRIHILHDGVEYDVSADIIRGQLIRRTNSVSTVFFTLSNKNLRYTTSLAQGTAAPSLSFSRMDPITVWMKRITWVQVFTGFLDSVPLLQLYEGTVDFRASCTLKKLLYTFWDPRLPQASQLMNQQQIALSESTAQPGTTPGNIPQPNAGNQPAGAGTVDGGGNLVTPANGSSTTISAPATLTGNGQVSAVSDSGLGDMLRNILIQVGKWQDSQIHISKIPSGFFEYVAGSLKDLDIDKDLLKLKKLFGYDAGGGSSAGSSAGLSGGSGSGAGGVLSDAQIDYVAKQAGFSGDGLVTAIAIAIAESHGDPKITNTAGNSAGTDRGLWQINSFYHPEVSDAQAFDPQGNANAAYQISSQGRDWTPWATYNNGAYQANLSRAQAAAAGTPEPLVGGNTNGTSSPTATSQSNAPQQIDPYTGNPIKPTATSPTSSAGKTNAQGSTTNANKPNPDSEGAVQFALAQCGKPYVWGATGPDSFDCSGLTQAAFAKIGVNLPRVTYDQVNSGTAVSGPPQRGDLVFNSDTSHVGISLGDGTMVNAATDTNPPDKQILVSSTSWMEPLQVRRVAQNGGADPNAPYNPNAQPGGAGTGTGGSANSNLLAKNLFSFMFSPNPFQGLDEILTGVKSYIQDEPLMITVQAITTSSLRNFCSAPNGDFVAWYPDYFGINNSNAILTLEDIEMIDVRIDLSDDPLSTHVFVAGDQTMQGAEPSIGGWSASAGVASIETAWLYKHLIAFSPGFSPQQDPAQLLKVFGLRPFHQGYSNIVGQEMEFMLAVQLFMQKWAEQYATQVSFTFMPELFPGMRINLANHDLQVYVQEVTHTFDFATGFTTQATINAPSNPNGRVIANQQINPQANGPIVQPQSSANTSSPDFSGTGVAP